jgi:hypothetical protein
MFENAAQREAAIERITGRILGLDIKGVATVEKSPHHFTVAFSQPDAAQKFSKMLREAKLDSEIKAYPSADTLQSAVLVVPDEKAPHAKTTAAKLREAFILAIRRPGQG